MDRGILTRLAQLRQVSPSRHLRRLRARWRLHRTEWNGRVRPLEPPPGYEHYYSAAQMFPGLHGRNPPVTNFKEFRYRLYWAWRLYRHHYKHDEEVAGFLRKEEEDDETYEQSRIRQRLEGFSKNVKKYTDKAGSTIGKLAGDAKSEFHAKRPEANAVLKDRSEVLKAAVAEFSKGYREGKSGPLNWLPLEEEDDDYQLPTVDVKPTRSESDSQSTSSSSPPSPSK